MTNTTEAVAAPSAKTAIIAVAVIIPVIVGWIILGTTLFKLTSFYASFLFAWFWFAIENADFKKWLPTLLGAFVGLGVTALASILPQALGEVGGPLALLVLIAVLIFLQLTNLVPIAVNHSTMLFLTVLGAPALLAKMNFVEVAAAIGLGALYFAGIAKLAQLATNRANQS